MLAKLGGADCADSLGKGFSDAALKRALFSALDKLEAIKPREKVLIIPPDYTRFHSRAGILTQFVYEYYGAKVKDIIPALGTHLPMTPEQLNKMFGGIPHDLFRVHDWRNDVVTIGKVPADLVLAASEGKANEEWPAQLNTLVWNGGHDLILSIGQVVPHEVMGMGNYNKNLLVGVGGADAIHFSHFIGAVYGMERMMGRADNGLRKILDYATEKFIKPKLPVVYVQTVIGTGKGRGGGKGREKGEVGNGVPQDEKTLDDEIAKLSEENKELKRSNEVLLAELEEKLKGRGVKDMKMPASGKGGEDGQEREEEDEEGEVEEFDTKGLFISAERDCFEEAARLSLQVNFTMLSRPLKKVIVMLDAEKYASTWIGNKAVYRTRMAIADGGELIILGPGVHTFGEDKEIDKVIRKYGYRTTPEVMEHLNNSRDLMKNLSAAAHLIHASSENRFTITWCPGKLTKEEILSVGFGYADLNDMMSKYKVETLSEGENTVELPDGTTEEIFFVPNPAGGLWAYKGRFEASEGMKKQVPADVKRTNYVAVSDHDGVSHDAGIGGGPTPTQQPPEKKRKVEPLTKEVSATDYVWAPQGWSIVAQGASELGFPETLVRGMYGNATSEGDPLTEEHCQLFRMKAPLATTEELINGLVERGIVQKR